MYLLSTYLLATELFGMYLISTNLLITELFGINSLTLNYSLLSCLMFWYIVFELFGKNNLRTELFGIITPL